MCLLLLFVQCLRLIEFSSEPLQLLCLLLPLAVLIHLSLSSRQYTKHLLCLQLMDVLQCLEQCFMLKDQRSQLWVLLKDLEHFDELSVALGCIHQVLEDLNLFLWVELPAANTLVRALVRLPLHVVVVFHVIVLVVVGVVLAA